MEGSREVSPKAGHNASANKVSVLLSMTEVRNGVVGTEQCLPCNSELFASVKSKNVFFLLTNGNRNYISLEFREK